MAEGERVGDPLPRRKRRTGGVAFAAALAATVAAWMLVNLLEQSVEGFSGGRFWATFWLLEMAALAAVVWLAGRRARPSSWARPAAGAAGGMVAGFALAILLAVAAFDGCGMAPESAHWKDQQMHWGLPYGGDHRGNPVTATAPPPGFAFRDADLDARWTGYSLVQVAWGRGIGYDFGPTVLVAEPGAVRATYLDLADLRAHRDEVVGFLQGFGAAPDEAARIAQAMEANATRGEEWASPQALEFHAALPADWAPRAAWDSFCCIGQQPADDASHGAFLGMADLRVGHWSFAFGLETKHMDGDGFTLDTDAEGRVEFRGLAMGDGEEAAYKAKVRRTLGALDLPQAEREGMSVDGSIC